MAKRYRPASKDNFIADVHTRLPVERAVAVYYRQSTDAQIGNISTALQTVDMVQYLTERGWSKNKIVMIDMDAGISGSTKIDERPGMRALFELITEAKIGAAACQDEDRLFRDVTQIQVNIFIEACRQSNVLVITPSMVYDFANEVTGAFHARQFRFKSEMAAEYINAVIRGKLHRAKRRLITEGRWGGSGTPPGYMVDMRRNLPDGTPNPDWRRYVPFEPYAEVVRAYFEMFLKNAGYINATVREIQEHGPYYPDPRTCPAPPGFKVHYKMYRYQRGYCPGKTGLVGVLTNAAYLGHWAVNDRVLLWKNHMPIVAEDVFTRAFNYLSEVNLDGQANRHYRPVQEHARPSREADRHTERPLCSGLIFSWLDGKWQRVSINWVKPLKHYMYILYSNGPISEYMWGKQANFVDQAITSLVLEKLAATFDAGAWEDTIGSFRDQYARARGLKLSQVSALEQVLRNLMANLETLTNPDMIRAAERRFGEAQAEQARLEGELREIEAEAKLLENVTAIKAAYQPALQNWPNLTRNEKRIILQAFIERIEAAPVEVHGLQVTVRWKDGSADQIILPRQATTGTQWLPSELEQLLSMVDAHCAAIEIARAFPNRTWAMIRNKVYRHRGKGSLKLARKPMKDNENYWDYAERVGIQDSLAHVDSEGRYWMNSPSLARACWR